MSEAVTIVVPVWNRYDLLDGLLRGLRAQTYPIDEVVIVDDGSAEIPAALGARVVQMGSHGGFAKAVNRGIREARTPLVAIVNNDVELAPDWLERLATAMTPDAWFATGKILQASARNRIDATYDAVCRGATAWRVGHGFEDGPAFNEPRQIWSPPFTAALFRKALFDRVGPLDERFESYLEDVDFGLRCALAGCAGRYVPDALAWHQGSATMGRWHPEVTRRIARNQVFLAAKHFPLRYIWHIAVAQLLWGFVALRHGGGWAWLRGKAEGLRRWSEFRGETRADLSAILCAHEREIHSPNLYWKLYFFFTTGGAK